MIQTTFRCCVLTGVLTFGALAAHAQEAQPEAEINETGPADEFPIPESTTEETPGQTQFSVDTRARFTFRADIQGTDADVQVLHSGLSLGMRHKLSERVTLLADVGFEYSHYDFGGRDVIDGESDPFSDLYSLGSLVTLSYAIDQQWSVFGVGSLAVAGEANAEVEDSLLGGGGAGVTWRSSDWFQISFGLAVRSQLEDDVLVTPLINFSWRLSETMRLESRSMPQGGGIGLTWELDDTSEFTLFGGVEYRQWRLDGGSGRLHDGVVRDLRVPLGAAMLWRFTPQFSLEVEGGAVVYQEYEFLDSSGDKIEDLDSDVAPFVGLKVRWTF